jgi:hypothetical protein
MSLASAQTMKSLLSREILSPNAIINDYYWYDSEKPKKGNKPLIDDGTTCVSGECLVPQTPISETSAFPGKPNRALLPPQSTSMWIHKECLNAVRSTPATNDGNSANNPTETKAPISDASQCSDQFSEHTPEVVSVPEGTVLFE